MRTTYPYSRGTERVNTSDILTKYEGILVLMTCANETRENCCLSAKNMSSAKKNDDASKVTCFMITIVP